MLIAYNIQTTIISSSALHYVQVVVEHPMWIDSYNKVQIFGIDIAFVIFKESRGCLVEFADVVFVFGVVTGVTLDENALFQSDALIFLGWIQAVMRLRCASIRPRLVTCCRFVDNHRYADDFLAFSSSADVEHVATSLRDDYFLALAISRVTNR